METAYKTIFGEFDKNNDGTLSRDEFLMGLDNYNK
jgi:Ca2+-binding EF-hand superfamily protein